MALSTTADAVVDMTSGVNVFVSGSYMGQSSSVTGLGAEVGPVRPTVDPADIRGLATTLLVSVGRLPRSRLEGRPWSPPNAIEGYAKPGPRLCSKPRVLRMDLRLDRYLLGDGPHEGKELARDGGDDDVGVLAAARESMEPLAESDLRLPSDVLCELREVLDPSLDVWGDLGRIAVGPGGFDQGASSAGIPGFGDRALAAFLAAGVLGGDEADEGSELAWVVKTGEVTELGNDGQGDDPLNAAQCLESLDHGPQTPLGGEFEEFLLDPREAFDLLVNGTQKFLEDDLLGGSRTDDPGEVTPVSRTPIGSTCVVKPKAQEEGLESELGGLEGDASGVAGATQITEGLVFDPGDVDRAQIAGAQEARELDGISSVGLDPIPGPLGDQGRCDDLALESFASEVSMQGVAAGAGLVGKDQVAGLAVESADESVDVALPGSDGADKVWRIWARGFGVGHADGVLVDIQTDEECGSLCHG